MTITEFLTSLGTTADEVADSLRAAGIRGIRSSMCNCPILNAVYQALPDYWPGLVILGSVTKNGRSYRATLGDSQICDPRLTPAIEDFIAKFDSGSYPDLAAGSVRRAVVTEYGP